jgi:polyphosphate kinase
VAEMKAPVAGVAAATAAVRDAAGRYENRELSWLEFNARVLALAENPDVPLLDRVRFVAIYSNNLDEFFQVRVAGVHEQLEANAPGGPDGLTPAQALAAIQARVRTLSTRRNRILMKSIIPSLAKEGIRIVGWTDLTKADRAAMQRRFEAQIFPVLTPLAVDPGHPFPYVSDLSLNLAVVVRDPTTRERRFARVKLPQNLPRFIAVEDGARYIPIEQLVAAHVDRLFPGMEIIAQHPFRVTRDADMEVEADEAEDLLAAIEESVLRRQRSLEAVRLEVDPTMPKSIVALLLEELDLTSRDVYVTKPFVGLGSMMELTKINRPDLRYEPWPSVTQQRLVPVARGARTMFEVIAEGDLLVQHPYDSWDTSVAAFLDAAAKDPKVLAIKQTLYRTSLRDSPVIQALIRAAAAGKQTVAMVELKARFDEQANIEWARLLEEAGVHVVYGVVGLKTHAKLSMVVRDEDGQIRRYCHVGTGNYHPGTATAYEDIGLMTADSKIGSDVSDLFNYITGYSRQDDYRLVLVAPLALRRELLALIEEETRAGADGRIIMKMNSLVDPQMIDALYDASATGVEIDLIVRGACCLRAQVPNLSEHIRVRSLVGRFLEHSRVFRFGSERRGVRYFMGSADLMQRNLDHRVEAVVPVLDPELQLHLQEILRIELEDDALAWELGPKGWSKVPPGTHVNANEALMALARSRTSHAGQSSGPSTSQSTG